LAVAQAGVHRAFERGADLVGGWREPEPSGAVEGVGLLGEGLVWGDPRVGAVGEAAEVVGGLVFVVSVHEGAAGVAEFAAQLIDHGVGIVGRLLPAGGLGLGGDAFEGLGLGLAVAEGLAD
jgi:hypothetical protein